MGIFLRKSVKLLPGVRLNLSTSGVGLSAGFGRPCWDWTAGRVCQCGQTRRLLQEENHGSGTPGIMAQKVVWVTHRRSQDEYAVPISV
jgi:hypothetical protein